MTRLFRRPVAFTALACLGATGFWAARLVVDPADGAVSALPTVTLPTIAITPTSVGLTTPFVTVVVGSSPPAVVATAAAATTAQAPAPATPAPAPDPAAASAVPASPTRATSTAQSPSSPTPAAKPKRPASAPGPSDSAPPSQVVAAPRKSKQPLSRLAAETVKRTARTSRRPERQAAPRRTSVPGAASAMPPPPSTRSVLLDAAADTGRAGDSFPLALIAATGAGAAGLVAAMLGLFVVGVRRRSAWETCEIALWRNDGDGEFHARTRRPKGEVRLAATSPLFRLAEDDTPPKDGAVLAAHNVIVQRLAWDGWQLQGHSDGEWWTGRYRRPVELADQ